MNGVAIRRADFERVVAGLEGDTRGKVGDADRRRVLDRMIDEELLVQRGLELGLASADRQIRATLAQAVIESVLSDVQSQSPQPGELEAFYEQNVDFFTLPGRLRVRRIYFQDGSADPEERAAEARRRLQAGEPLDHVRRELGDPPIAPLPDAMLPATKLREYLGPTLLRAALALEVGEPSAPLRQAGGLHVLQVNEREPARAPAFREIAPQVEAEWRRTAGEAALRAYLDDLRARAELSRADPP